MKDLYNGLRLKLTGVLFPDTKCTMVSIQRESFEIPRQTRFFTDPWMDISKFLSDEEFQKKLGFMMSSNNCMFPIP